MNVLAEIDSTISAYELLSLLFDNAVDKINTFEDVHDLDEYHMKYESMYMLAKNGEPLEKRWCSSMRLFQCCTFHIPPHKGNHFQLLNRLIHAMKQKRGFQQCSTMSGRSQILL